MADQGSRSGGTNAPRGSGRNAILETNTGENRRDPGVMREDYRDAATITGRGRRGMDSATSSQGERTNAAPEGIKSSESSTRDEMDTGEGR